MKKNILVIILFMLTFFTKAQEFKFNPDCSSEKVLFKIDKPATEIYGLILSWIQKHFYNPGKQIIDSENNKMVRLDAGMFQALKKEVDYRKDAKRYSATYELLIEIRDGYYTLNYIHKTFTLNSKPVDLTLQDILAQKIITIDIPQDAKENYEYKVNKLMNLLYLEIIEKN